MGVHAMVKGTMSKMMKKNSSNIQMGRLFGRRIASVAESVDCSGEKSKQAKCKAIATAVEAQFRGDDLQDQIGPVTFLIRREAIDNGDKALNQLMPPEPDWDRRMDEAAQKDLESLNMNLHDLCESSICLIREIYNRLPSKKSLKEERISEHILTGNARLSGMQVEMARLIDKVSDLQQLGYIDPNVVVMILRLEEPDGEALHWSCGIEETVGEMLQRVYLQDPLLPKAGSPSTRCNQDEDNEEMIPDVWVRRQNEVQNSVTASSHWWEHQAESNKIRDIFAANGENPQAFPQRWTFEVVSRKVDYVVALVNEDGVERGGALDLLNGSRKHDPTGEYMESIFSAHRVVKIMDLKRNKDASKTMFNKLTYQPRTNPLYLEIETCKLESERGKGKARQINDSITTRADPMEE